MNLCALCRHMLSQPLPGNHIPHEPNWCQSEDCPFNYYGTVVEWLNRQQERGRLMTTRTIKVTGTIGDYDLDQELNTEQEIAAYLRTILNEGAESESNLTDEEILVCFRKHYDDKLGWDEDTEVVCIEELERI